MSNKQENVVEKIESDELLDEQEKETEFEHAEGGWGWVVVISTGYIFGILMGFVNNYALILNEFDSAYNNTQNHIFYAAWIGSGATGVQYILCFLGSSLVDLYGARRVGFIGAIISTCAMTSSIFVKNILLYFATYSLAYGIGQALLLSSTLSILPHYFNKSLSLANGVMNLISSVIVITLPVCTAPIIARFSLKGTFTFLSALNLVTVFLTLTYKPRLPERETKKKSVQRFKQSLALGVLAKKEFLIWSFCSLIGQFGYLIPILVIDHHSVKLFPEYEPVYLNVAFALASGCGAVVFGKIGDKTNFSRVHYHTLFFTCYGLVQLTLLYTSSFYMLVVQSALLGIFDGVYLSFIVPICFDITKSSHLANQAAGFHHAVISIPSVSGPALAGRLYEIYHNYNVAFLIGGITCLTGAVLQTSLMLSLGLYRRRQARDDIILKESEASKTNAQE